MKGWSGTNSTHASRDSEIVVTIPKHTTYHHFKIKRFLLPHFSRFIRCFAFFRMTADPKEDADNKNSPAAAIPRKLYANAVQLKMAWTCGTTGLLIGAALFSVHRSGGRTRVAVLRNVLQKHSVRHNRTTRDASGPKRT